jgi:hypothetical protein
VAATEVAVVAREVAAATLAVATTVSPAVARGEKGAKRPPYLAKLLSLILSLCIYVLFIMLCFIMNWACK